MLYRRYNDGVADALKRSFSTAENYTHLLAKTLLSSMWVLALIKGAHAQATNNDIDGYDNTQNCAEPFQSDAASGDMDQLQNSFHTLFRNESSSTSAFGSLFGEGGGKKLAKMSNSVLLGQVPLVQGIREAGDAGKPISLEDQSQSGEAFLEVARNTIRQVAVRHEVLDPTKIVQVKE